MKYIEHRSYLRDKYDVRTMLLHKNWRVGPPTPHSDDNDNKSINQRLTSINIMLLPPSYGRGLKWHASLAVSMPSLLTCFVFVLSSATTITLSSWTCTPHDVINAHAKLLFFPHHQHAAMGGVAFSPIVHGRSRAHRIVTRQSMNSASPRVATSTTKSTTTSCCWSHRINASAASHNDRILHDNNNNQQRHHHHPLYSWTRNKIFSKKNCRHDVSTSQQQQQLHTSKNSLGSFNINNKLSQRLLAPMRKSVLQFQQRKQQQQQQTKIRHRARFPRGLFYALITLFVGHTSLLVPFHRTLSSNNVNNNAIVSTFLLPLAWAGGGGMVKRHPDAAPLTPLSTNELASKLTIWLAVFFGLALLHAAEIAITTLYPWKVREFAEEEEKQRSSGSGGSGVGMGNKQRPRRGTFQTLNEDITRVLTTILVTSTACSIYATTLFTHLADHIFGGARAEKWSAIFLTAITLFFVELLPKNIGVINAERVARLMVPPINVLANAVGPFGYALSYLAKATLRLFGIKSTETSGVSDSELRLIVTGARDSGTIDYSEQEMIKGVLNLQDQKVREIMKPRVEIVAVPKSMSVASVLGVVRESGYSRIPVYVGEIDNIVGIVLAKSVLDFFVKGVLVDGEYRRPRDEVVNEESGGTGVGGDGGGEQGSTADDIGKLSFIDPPTGKTMDRYVRSLTGSQLASRMETTIDDAGLIESCYFVPETANGWSVLQEMRRRRVHMAVVVDEYGGTEGLVSLEDIVEQVVGEIYDEDDEDDFVFEENSIIFQEDGTFLIRGDADLEDVDAVLGLNLDEEEVLKEYGTLSGFLCFCAGEIPHVGDFVMSRGWKFQVADGDEKRVFQVKVERLLGYFDGEDGDDGDENLVLGFFNRKNANSDEANRPETHVNGDAGDESVSAAVEAVVQDDMSHAEVISRQARVMNMNEASRVERLVEQNAMKAAAVREIVSEKRAVG